MLDYGDAAERRSAYAKATADKYDPPSLLRAMEDKLRKSSGWMRCLNTPLCITI